MKKAELIEALVVRGVRRAALNKMNLAALQAEYDKGFNPREDAESIDVILAEEAEAIAALSGDLTIPIEEVKVGDTWGGNKVSAVQFGPRWCYLQDKAGRWFLRVVAGQKVMITR